MQAYLYLEDRSLFLGRAFGADLGPEGAVGELVFSTSQSGYQELLTDPSYCGQILISTSAHVGSVGINPEDHESHRPWVEGFVVADLPRRYSNWRARVGLSDWLAEQCVPGLCGVDTRALVLHLREQGAMRAVLATGAPTEQALDGHRARLAGPSPALVQRVTRSQVQRFHGSGPKIACLDFGMKANMFALLQDSNADLTVFPAHCAAAEILESQPDGVFLSNGPGDPAVLEEQVQTVQALVGKQPIFGICLGHQLLARALGAETYKLKFGHRGTNHPVLDLATGRVEITTQNHGYAVCEESLPTSLEVTHRNLNDGTVEGLAAPDHRAFSVQYHPENGPGPHDSRYLFDRFFQMLEVSCA